jgi:hypothetical protein
LNVALGKLEHKPDPKTLRMAQFIADTVVAPVKFDFDRGRKPFVQSPYGNDAWGNCVMVGRANQLLRFERVEQWRTIPITTEQVVEEYKRESARQFGDEGPKNPGDSKDRGLYVIEALKGWQKVGWNLDYRKKPKPGTERRYHAAAYGEIDPLDRMDMRKAIFALQGVQLGFWLPRAAQGQTWNGFWDYSGQSGPEWQPGSWGGHLVYAKRYDPENIYVITWGREIRVSNAFVERYCDEAWAVVDNFDNWLLKSRIDVPALKKKLSEITGRNFD